MKRNITKAMTSDELADAYDEMHFGSSRPARTLPMDYVFEWAEKQTDKFYVHPKDGTLHRIVVEKSQAVEEIKTGGKEMSNETTVVKKMDGELLEKVLVGGNLSDLSPTERVNYYMTVCNAVGVNPATRPFSYIVLNGKLTLYANRDCADQLRKRDNISIEITCREVIEGAYIVTAKAKTGERVDESIGAVFIENLKGQDRANAMMKSETKAKRRVTLSISGLGFLDETEIQDIADVKVVDVAESGEIKTIPPEPVKKPTRPYPAETVRENIQKLAQKHTGKSCSQEQKNLLVGMLEICFAGSSKEISEMKRHQVCSYLTGEASSKKITNEYIIALLDWLKPTQDSGGAYMPDGMAVKEVGAILIAQVEESGQEKLI